VAARGARAAAGRDAADAPMLTAFAESNHKAPRYAAPLRCC